MARKMKDSGIEWIGEIPEGWRTINPKALFTQRKDKAQKGERQLTSSQQYGILYQDDYMELTGSKVVTVEKDFDILKHVEAGDFVISMRSFQGGLEYSTKSGAISSAYIMLVPNLELVYPRFYKWLLKSSVYIDALQRTTNMVRDGQAMRYSNFAQVRLFTLPLDEQKSRADFLDLECSSIDKILSKTRSSIEEYKKLKQAVITQAVTKGVRGEREMKDSGVEWIREIPVDWEISRIKYVSIFEPSCDFKKLTPETIITYSPMECIKNGTFERRTSLYGNLAHTLTPFQNGDIVMAKVTPCFENGNIAIMNELQSGYGLGSSELFVFRPQNINTRYLFYWLQNKLFVHQACATMTGTGGLKRISPSFVKNCNIHYPSAAEQAQIAAYLDAKCAEIDGLIAKKEQLVKELESYKKSLIYEVVTGKREV
jgi:type I restriction enzyme S subunit